MLVWYVVANNDEVEYLSKKKYLKWKIVNDVVPFSKRERCVNPWETDYEAIVRKYREKGYGERVPEIVSSNLRDSTATPMPANQKGVALVSDFLKNLIKIFLEKGGVMDSVAVMEAAIAGEEYEKLVVPS